VEKVTEVFNHRKCVDGDVKMVNDSVRAQQGRMQLPAGVPAGERSEAATEVQTPEAEHACCTRHLQLCFLALICILIDCSTGKGLRALHEVPCAGTFYDMIPEHDKPAFCLSPLLLIACASALASKLSSHS
jgi:hypothetical protein